MTDTFTGLMWTKNGNLPNGTRTWQGALDYVKSLNKSGGVCGYTDWRLSNSSELESLFNAGYKEQTCDGSSCSDNAAWLNTQGFTNVQTDGYWSSTNFGGSDYACFVIMGEGYVDGANKRANNYVWPVRTGQR
ncbi:MAG: DUF1566 domain-containing protein [Thermodesulfovibrionales bacterium]|nr:DUF1566 domain-containing protein [Thermodesulfovibrionales bacterium]